jgi:glutaredoxin-like protein
MSEKLLNEEIIGQIEEIFDRLEREVEVLYFEQQDDCTYCADTRQLLEEVTAISDKITLRVHDLDADQALAQQYRVDKAPGFALVGKDGADLMDYGVRFAGIPSGHEFSSLIHDLIRVSSGDSGLSEQTRQQLKGLKTPIHLMVFVTPTCPYCPQAVLLAHQLAMESPMIEAEMVEATEFPDLTNRYHVSGVPQTTINFGAGTVVGAVPEAQLLAEVLRVNGAA